MQLQPVHFRTLGTTQQAAARQDGEDTQHRLGLVEVTVRRISTGRPNTSTTKHEETFYVVSGTPTFTCGTDAITADLGTLGIAPIGTPHTFGNPATFPRSCYVVLAPDR